MTEIMAAAPLTLGFLTVLHEASGFVGGFLVTNSWGRPLEFRLSTAVQPNRVQQILYGETLQPYIYADLIGKALLEKTFASTQLVLTDRQPVLELRQRLTVPVVWLAPAEEVGAKGLEVRPGTDGRGRLLCHSHFPSDVVETRSFLEQLDFSMDLIEPFARIREAIAESRKIGIAGRN